MLKKQLTEQELLKKVDDYNIFNHYFGNFDFAKCYPSVFRKDYHPSTGFFVNKEGRVVYNDLSSGEKLGSVGFVAKLYNLSYYEAIDKIAKDFGVIEGIDKSQRVKVKAYKPAQKKHKTYEVTRGKWRQEELDYWKQFSITQKELEENFISPCRELKINGYVIENPMNYLRFVYTLYDEEGHPYIKVYSPHDPVFKWIGSTPKNVLFGWKELEFKSKKLIIAKAQKDRVIWKKYFPDVIASQSENKGSIPPEIAEKINQHYNPEDVYISFDCDKAGKEGAQYFIDTYGWNCIFVPDIYYEKFKIKDFADLVKEKGLETFEKYLKWKKLL